MAENERLKKELVECKEGYDILKRLVDMMDIEIDAKKKQIKLLEEKLESYQ
jgi:hypothetical protein